MATTSTIPESQAASSRRMYNSTADVYDNSHHPKFALDLLNLVETKPGEHVLDLACGTGLGTVPAAERVGPSGYVVGLDVSDGMLAEAHKKVAAAGYGEFVKLFSHSISDLPSLPELRGKEGTFDVVMCSSALVLLEDPIAALRQWTTYLKPGTGKLVFDVTHPSTQPQGYLLGLAAKTLGLPMYQNRTWAAGEDALRKAIAEVKDLKIESTPFMRQHEWESRDFDGDEVEGAKQYDIFVGKEAFKHLDRGEPGQRQAMKAKFVELWCQEATKGDIIGTGGRGKVVELGGVNGAVCTRK